jgi:hypothetical protein
MPHLTVCCHTCCKDGILLISVLPRTTAADWGSGYSLGWVCGIHIVWYYWFKISRQHFQNISCETLVLKDATWVQRTVTHDKINFGNASYHCYTPQFQHHNSQGHIKDSEKLRGKETGFSHHFLSGFRKTFLMSAYCNSEELVFGRGHIGEFCLRRGSNHL